MQMCAGFAAADAAVKLVARDPGPKRLATADLQRHYDVPPVFDIEQRPLPRGARVSDMFQVQSVMREHNRDDYICYTRGRDVLAALIASSLGKSTAIEIHGLPISLRERWMLKRINTNRHGRLVAISSQLKNIYCQTWGFQNDSFSVAPDGVNLDRFTPLIERAEARESIGLDPGRWVIYVGGLYQGRGLEALFAAQADISANLLIVGGRDESEVAAWRERAFDLGAMNTHFSGYQPPSMIPTYLQAADVLVMPYAQRTRTPSGEDTTAWMSPLKMFEYMAAERPIVATNLPALQTVLRDTENALLVPPDDPAALARAVSRALDEPALAHQIATNARRTVTEFTWEARARKILASLND